MATAMLGERGEGKPFAPSVGRLQRALGPGALLPPGNGEQG